MWGGLVCGIKGGGVGGLQRNLTTSGGLSGFSHWDLNTTETPNFLFGTYQRMADPFVLEACRSSKKTSQKKKNVKN